jgi:L-alanine-DL-glutamate epimerase-like enolase superfamily enzyme
VTAALLPPTAPLRVERLSVAVYRAPVERPVRTAFGAMTNRPAVIVRAEGGGAEGFGEIWCNFPSCGAEHRARLLESVFRPWVTGGEWPSPAAAFAELSARSHRLALQAGEPGPIAQVLAGIDTALWDLAARQAGVPLWRLLGGGQGRMPAYASGINPDGTVRQAEVARAAGFRAFKLKIGFGADLDLENLAALRSRLGPDVQIAVDANQAWGLDEAVAMSRALARYAPLWLEEPLAADSPLEDWQRLAEASPVPLAAGENLRGDAAFDAAIAGGALRFIQPDLAKWGGITGCLPLARRINEAGLCYCPHFLGGGIGLLASAHLLAAAGGDGLLEIDSNANPLREGLAAPFPALEDGQFVLSEEPGLGVAPGAEVERFAVTVLA